MKKKLQNLFELTMIFAFVLFASSVESIVDVALKALGI